MRATVHTIHVSAVTDEHGHSPAHDRHEVRLCGVWVHETTDLAAAERRASLINDEIAFIAAISVHSAPLLTPEQQAL